MIFVPVKGVQGEVSFQQDTLIVPVVSTGNVGQLAVDLFLSSGRTSTPPLVEKVGYLESDLVAPAVGYEVFGPGQPPTVCVNLELHRFSERGVTVLQQRGAVFPGEEQAFALELVVWARASGFKDILALTGADAAGGLDPAPLGRGRMSRYRAGTLLGRPGGQTPAPAPCALEEALSLAGVGEFDQSGAMMNGGWPMAPMGGSMLDTPGGNSLHAEFGMSGREEDETNAEASSSQGFPHMPPLPTGTGVAGHLCKEAVSGVDGRGGSPPLVVLLHFCSEGDNTPHAVQMAEAVNASLKILPGNGDGDGVSPPGAVRWSSPLSWASLYGPPPAADAYQ